MNNFSKNKKKQYAQKEQSLQIAGWDAVIHTISTLWRVF
jgi:hypothetical protein